MIYDEVIEFDQAKYEKNISENTYPQEDERGEVNE